MTEQEYKDAIRKMIWNATKNLDRRYYIPEEYLKKERLEKLKQLDNGIKN